MPLVNTRYMQKIIGYLTSLENVFRQYCIRKRFSKIKCLYIRETDVKDINKNILWKEIALNLDQFSYFDEKDNYVKELDKYFKYRFYHIPFRYTAPSYPIKKVVGINNGVRFISNDLSNDWLYLYSNNNIGDFKLDFCLTLQSEFKEFQVAFRHVSIFERLRFRIVQNRDLVFEVVSRGVFYNNLISTPCSLEIKKMYHISIMAYQFQYVFCLDKTPLLIIDDYHRRFNCGGLAFIAWDPVSPSCINCEITNIKLQIPQ